jgi:hypothetical protein
MVSDDRNTSVVFALGVGHAVGWLLFAAIGLIFTSVILVFSLGRRPSWTDAGVLGVVLAGFICIALFQGAVLRNTRLSVDNSQIVFTNFTGRRVALPLTQVERVEQYREVKYLWLRYGTTTLLTRVVSKDGRNLESLRISKTNARRLAKILRVPMTESSSIARTLLSG